jgi:hypothetical protein
MTGRSRNTAVGFSAGKFDRSALKLACNWRHGRPEREVARRCHRQPMPGYQRGRDSAQLNIPACSGPHWRDAPKGSANP